MTFRYIGSKARIAEAIADRLGPPRHGQRLVDLFCGTGAVAEAAARRGWDVLINDNLYAAVVMAAARLTDPDAARFRQLGGYDAAVERLNSLPAAQGFIWREYTPATQRRLGFERRYFTEANGGRIDAVRRQIRLWAEGGELSAAEERLLIADLLSAANRVANIAGTYGCFLSEWQSQALGPLSLRPRILSTIRGSVGISVGDASLVATGSGDVVYLDPPYTKRQYAAYYHLVETIVRGDEPVVEGITGLRPWQHKASDFCYKRRALGAFERLAETVQANQILISYSDEGHVPLDALTKVLARNAIVRPTVLDEIPRYRPNRTASAGRTGVREYLLEVVRQAEAVAA